MSVQYVYTIQQLKKVYQEERGFKEHKSFISSGAKIGVLGLMDLENLALWK